MNAAPAKEKEEEEKTRTKRRTKTRKTKSKERHDIDFEKPVGAQHWPSWCARLVLAQKQIESVAAFLHRRRMVLDVNVIAQSAGCTVDDISRIVACE